MILPVLIQNRIAYLHVVQPLAIPGVQLGRTHPGDGGPEGAVGSGAVHTYKNAEVERDPWVS